MKKWKCKICGGVMYETRDDSDYESPSPNDMKAKCTKCGFTAKILHLTQILED